MGKTMGQKENKHFQLSCNNLQIPIIKLKSHGNTYIIKWYSKCQSAMSHVATNVGIILTGMGVENKNLDINLTTLDLREEKEQPFL